jgi:hypothetical protein
MVRFFVAAPGGESSARLQLRAAGKRDAAVQPAAQLT